MGNEQPGTNEKLEMILAYARRGWAVLPLWSVDARRRAGKAKCACGNPDCPSPGKHPIGPLVPQGLKQATTDEAVIRRWFKAYPDANVGIATGKRSGIWAVDVDTIHEGDLSLEALLQEHGSLPLTPHSLTGGGGDHYILLCPADQEIGNCRLAQGIDIKGEQGYIVVPPSHHASGFDYAWEVTEHFEDVPPAEAPAWLLDMIRTRTAPKPTEIPEVVAEWATDMPPVLLPAWGMAFWTGERVIDSSDGEEKVRGEAVKIDRSETLWSIGMALKSGGADGPQIAAALANRDETLGYHKYSQRRNGFSGREYNRIAAKVMTERPEPEGTPHLTLGGKGQVEETAAEDTEPNVDMSVPDPTARWAAIPASEIDPNGERVTWLWEGYLAVGAITELVGLWKSGKTTLLCHLVKSMEKGGMFCGMPLSRCKVLVITEEHSSLWAERRDELGIIDNVWFTFRPFLGKPNLRTWRAYILYVVNLVITHGFDVVIFDPLTSQAPIENENDNAEMTTVIVEFRRIVEAGAAVLIAHHPAKGAMGQGKSSRGAGALPGFVDILLEFGRFAPERAEDTRRVLMGLSRYKETPTEVVIELVDEGYIATGTMANSTASDRGEVILSLLSDMPVTRDAIRQSWPEGCAVPRPGDTILKKTLQTLEREGRLTVTGTGKRGEPYLYARKQD